VRDTCYILSKNAALYDDWQSSIAPSKKTNTDLALMSSADSPEDVANAVTADSRVSAPVHLGHHELLKRSLPAGHIS
jgi:hypothetical protein